jgi:hypothetical protein
MIELLASAFQPEGGSFYLPLLNYGVLGIAVVALAIGYLRKDSRVDTLQEKRIEDQAQYAERYRLALVEMNKTLDATLRMIQKNPGG